MQNSIMELIETLERLKAEIEWDYSLEYQVAISEVIEVLKHVKQGQGEAENR